MTDSIRPQVAPMTTCRTSGIGPCEFQLEGGAFCPGGRCLKYGEQVEDTALGDGAPPQRDTKTGSLPQDSTGREPARPNEQG